MGAQQGGAAEQGPRVIGDRPRLASWSGGGKPSNTEAYKDHMRRSQEPSLYRGAIKGIQRCSVDVIYRERNNEREKAVWVMVVQSPG